MEINKFNVILQSVSGSLRSKLERIRRYLYLEKASVMVGAGFSRNAEVPSQIPVKQWSDVGKDIYCRLNNVDETDDSNLIFKTPMRLASQFAASFGRSELDNLIKDSIPDDRMNPGSLHKQLLSLPWRDIFTTNYDTLLERAQNGVLRKYSVVTSKEMLLYKNSPRIIKLHGSFPDKTPFLMTEEDFRTYPSERPEFVNTVRQALVESIFCLIGFSGDDPNFTSWQGWLRDVMGDYAGPSYLITWDQNYDESFKTLMAHRGIEVINLSLIAGLDDYKKALDFFFTYLSDRLDWKGEVQYDVHNVNAATLIDQLKSVRLAYPGWFILPQKYYGAFSDTEYYFPYLETAYNSTEEQYKEPLLYELDWRADIALAFKDFGWYRKGIEEVVDSYGETPFSQQAITLGISLLRLYRHHPESYNKAQRLQKRLINEMPRMTAYQTTSFYYCVACNALSVMDYDTVLNVLDKWNPLPTDYEGFIYKSMVMAETGDLSKVTELLKDPYDRITQSLSQNNTPKEQSLHSVIENLLSFYCGERMPGNDPRFSFLSIRDYIFQNINKPIHESFEIKHGFGIGSENRSWNTSSGTMKDLFHAYQYLLFCEAYGFPYGLANNSVDAKKLARVLPTIVSYGMAYSLGPVIRSGNREVTVAYSNRYTLNFLTREQADLLAMQLLKAYSKLSCEKAKEHRAKEVLLPFLSRLSSLCSSEIVVKIFKFALQTYRNNQPAPREDINIIYSNMLPDAIQEAYKEAFSSSIYIDIQERDIPLPETGLNYYTPGNIEISIAIEGLASTDKRLRDSAYNRISCLYKSNISEENRNALDIAIRRWRKDELANNYTRHSYQIVSPVGAEEMILKDQIRQDLSSFLSADFKYTGTSLTVSSLLNEIHNIGLQAKYMTNEQMSSVLYKIAVILDENYEGYSKDDSQQLMGGLRSFTLRLFKVIGELIRVISFGDYSDKNACKQLLIILQKYLYSHLPVRIMMERLNNISRVLSLKKMRVIITEQLFSKNEEDVIDSCNGLIAFAYNSPNFQTDLQRIIFYCNHEFNDMTRLYLQTLVLIPKEKITKRTQEQLASMMKNILLNLPTQDMSEERKADILHDCVRLAASLKTMPTNSPVVSAVKEWEKYATDEEIYNDIRRPWYL